MRLITPTILEKCNYGHQPTAIIEDLSKEPPETRAALLELITPTLLEKCNDGYTVSKAIRNLRREPPQTRAALLGLITPTLLEKCDRVGRVLGGDIYAVDQIIDMLSHALGEETPNTRAALIKLITPEILAKCVSAPEVRDIIRNLIKKPPETRSAFVGRLTPKLLAKCGESDRAGTYVVRLMEVLSTEPEGTTERTILNLLELIMLSPQTIQNCGNGQDVYAKVIEGSGEELQATDPELNSVLNLIPSEVLATCADGLDVYNIVKQLKKEPQETRAALMGFITPNLRTFIRDLRKEPIKMRSTIIRLITLSPESLNNCKDGLDVCNLIKEPGEDLQAVDSDIRRALELVPIDILQRYGTRKSVSETEYDIYDIIKSLRGISEEVGRDLLTCCLTSNLFRICNTGYRLANLMERLLKLLSAETLPDFSRYDFETLKPETRQLRSSFNFMAPVYFLNNVKHFLQQHHPKSSSNVSPNSSNVGPNGMCIIL